MFNKTSLIIIVAFILGSCASVPMESLKGSNDAKQFALPSNGMSGLYIYRSSFLGKVYKKDIWVDDKCIGESANDVFFYVEVPGNREHRISTESVFSPNNLIIKTEAGKNYFVEQYIKLGVSIKPAELELVNNKKGMSAVSILSLAKKGTCSK